MGRLFWKIFAWFTLTALLIALVLLAISRLSQPQGGTAQVLLERGMEQRLDTVEALLAYGGAPALQAYLERRGDRRPRVWVLDADTGEDLLGRRVPRRVRTLSSEQQMTRAIIADDGREYRLLMYRPPARLASPLNSRWRQLRQTLPAPQRLLLFLVASVLASAWLAWYLTRPIRVLSAGARQLAAGEQTRPLTPQLGGRQDELTALASEFDRMNDALQARQQAFQQLLNDISHELRSPLTRLRLRFALLERQQRPLSADEEVAVTGELDRLESLIDQVLTLARLDADSHYQREDHIDLPALVAALCDQIALEAEVKGCQIRYLSEAPATVLRVNAELIRRAFENVIRNAVSHSPAGAPVEVELCREVDGLRVEIRDQGEGVPETALAQMFSPFVRLESSRPRGGYGLGLAITQRAVQLHQGQVRAFNRASGGLAVEIRLPIAALRQELR